MASDTENNELNDAVEQVSSTDGGIDNADTVSSNQQNRESTVTSTVASSGDTLTAATAEENLEESAGGEDSASSGTSESSDSSEESTSGAAGQSATSSDSNVVEGDTSEPVDEEGVSASSDQASEEESTSTVSSGAQSVGGSDITDSSTTTSGSATPPPPGAVNSEPSTGETVGEGATSETVASGGSTAETSQTFEVNVGSDTQSGDSDDLPTTDTADTSLVFEVNVSPENDAPTAVDKLFSMEEDGAITFTAEELLAGSADIEGDDLSISSVNYSGSDGVLTSNEDGTFTFAPNENYNGNVDLSFSVSDGTTTTDANIGLSIEGVNDVPVAGSTSYQVNEDGVINLSSEQLLANSSDVDGSVSLESVSYSGTDGILTTNDDGSVSFAPNENFNGEISLDVTIVDDNGATATTTAGIETIAVNDTPVVDGNLAYSLDEDGSITLSQEQLLANASDVDGDDLSASNLSVGDNATVTANDDGSFTVTPDADFNGDLDLSFDVSDASGATVASNVDLTVNPVNDAAVVQVQSFSMDEDGIITITDAQLLSGASDIDGDDLSVTDVTYTGTDGVLTDNGDGTHSFAPNENFNGEVEVGFSVSDGTITTDANIDLTVTDVNDAPVAGSTSYQVNEDGVINISADQLLANSTDVDGTVSVDSVNYSGTDGILTSNDDGSVSFAPNENFNGDISLDVTIIDDDGATLTTTAGIEAIAVNDTPVVDGNLAYSVDEDGSITLSQEQLLANASDVDGDDLTASSLSVGDNATVTANEDGSFTIVPDADFNGDLDLSFDVSDASGATVASNVDLTVNPTNDAVIVQNQSFTTNEDGSITITDAQLLSSASDIDAGDTLSVAGVTYTGADGVLTDNGDGTHTFSPNENFNGEVDLGFSVSDGTTTTAANIDLTVTDVNDVPVAGSTSYQVNEDGQITISPAQLLANSSDVDGAVTLDSVSYSGTDGILIQNQDGSVTFSPNENFNGDISLNVTVIDDDGATSSTTAGIDVIAVNDTSVVEGSLSYSMAEDGTITLSQDQLLSNVSDVDGDTLTAANLSAGDNATVTANDDGSFTITPNEHSNEALDISFDVSDGTDSVVSSGSISVSGVADAVQTNLLEEAVNDGSINANAESYENFEGGSAETEAFLTGTLGTAGGQDVYTFHHDGGPLTLNALTELSSGSEYNDLDGSGTQERLDIMLELTTANGTRVAFNDDGGTAAGSDAVSDGSLHGYDSYIHQDSLPAGDYFVNVTSYAASSTGPYSITMTGNFELEENPYETELGETLIIDNTMLLSNDEVATDFSMTSVQEAQHGTVSINSEGDIEFIPNDDYAGIASFTYTITDANGNEDTARVTLNVTGENTSGEEAVLQADILRGVSALTMTEDETSTFTELLGPVTFPDSDGSEEHTVRVEFDATVMVEAPVYIEDGEVHNFTLADGVYFAEVNGDNLDDIQISMPENFSGNVTGEVTLIAVESDVARLENGEIDTSSDGYYEHSHVVNLNVSEVDDAIVLGVESTKSVDEDGQTTITFSATDPDGEIVSTVASAEHGEVVVNEDGTISYTPDADYNGADTVIVTTTNDDGLSVTETSAITVNDINDGPTITSSHYAMNEDGQITISPEQLLENSADIDGTVTLESVNYSGSDGILTQNEDGSVTFSPNENFNGDIPLTVTVVDDDGATASTTSTLDVVAVNDTPVVDGNLAYSVDEDGSITLSQEQLLANASDIDGDDLSASNLSVGENASVTANDDGSFTVTPDADFNGDLDLSFDVSDASGVTVASNVDLTVNPTNDAAVVQDQSFSMDEDGTITITDEQLLAGASDIDGDDLSIADVTYTGTDGVLTDNGDGTHSFAPNENFNGEVDLGFSVSDGTTTTEANIDISVTDVNDAPVAGSTSYQVNEDGVINISTDQLLANSTDVDGTVSVDSVTYSGTDGILTTNDDGSVSFAPNENFNGDISLDVTIIDDDGATATTTAGIETIAVNDTPIVDGNLAYSVDEDGSITLSQEQLLANASDVEGEDLTASGLSVGDNATVTTNDDGSFTITPDADFNGDLDLSFDVSDASGATVASNVDLTVNPVNDAAVVSDVTLAGTEDNTITITQADLLSTATDVDGNALTASNLSIDDSFGAVTDNGDGSFSFAPADDFNGEVPFSFTVSDGTANTSAHGSLNVAAVNDVPVLAETAFVVNEDNSIIITEAELLANATDVDADALSITNISAPDGNGTVVQNDNGDWVYTPTDDYSGDANLTISVNDGTETVDFNSPVTITPDADAPSLTVSLAQTDVAEFGDSSISGGVLSGWQTDNGGGLIEVNPDYIYGVGENRGSVMELERNAGDESNVYQNLDIEVGDTVELSFDISARAGMAGADSQVDIYFEGVLIDSIQPQVGWETHTYSLTATTDNPRLELDSPSHNGVGAVLDVITVKGVTTTEEESAIAIDISSALNDEDGSESMQSLDVANLPEGAILTDGTNTFTATGESNSVDVKDWDLSSLTVTTAENFSGDVTLDVIATSVEDANGDTASTTESLTFSVADVNDAVVIDADSALEFNASEDTTFTITEDALLANASDVDSEDLIVTNLSIPNATFITVIDAETGDKSFVVTPSENFNGDVDIAFSVSDQEGSEVQSGASLTIAAVNDEAVVQDQAFSMNEDGIITITDAQLLAGASDVDGDDLSIEDVTYTGTDGVLTDNGDGTHSFSPNENFNGEVDLGFSVSDGTATTQANIDISVADVNDAPVAGSTSYQVNEDGVINISAEQLLANSSDVDGSVSLDSVSYSGTDGILTTNDDGSVSFAPNENFNGDISLDVTIIDDDGATATTTAGIETIAVNDTPVVDGNLAYSVDEDGSITLSQDQLLANASDIDGDDLTASSLTVGGNATVTTNDDGSFTVVPDADFNGDLDLSFDVTDTSGATVASNVDLTVNPTNDAAVVQDQSFSMDEDGIITITDAQLLAGASDIDAGDTLSVAEVTYTGTDGVLTDNGDGTHSFAPNENFNGEVDLGFSVSDGTATTQANIDISVADVNDAPVAGSTSYQVNEDGVINISPEQLLANSSDVDGYVSLDSVSYSGTDGILTTNDDGSVSFAPNENFNGDISLDVTVIDDDGATATTTAGIETLAVNDTPVVDGNLAYSVDEDGSITLSQEQLLANASDIDGDDLTASGLSVGGNATVTANDDGSFTVVPDADFNGDLDLSFDVTDPSGATVANNVDLTVNPTNDAAVVQDQAFTMDEDGIITITDAQLLAGASDIDGDDLSIADVTYTGSDGVLTDNGDGTHSFAPNENFNGEVDLGFSVSDGTTTTQAGISITFDAVNDLPDAPTINLDGTEDQAIIIDPAYIISQANDIDGDNLSLENLSVRQPANATLTTNQDGTYSLVTPENFNGLIDLAYVISDGNGVDVEGSLNMDIIPVDDAPFQNNNAHLTSVEDTEITFSSDDLTNLFGDVDSNVSISRVITADGEEADGDVVDNGDGTWTFVPAENFNGTTELQIIATDGTTETTVEMPIYIRPVADGTVITTDHEGPLVFGEDSTGHFGLNVEMLDTSETLQSLMMTGYPVGFVVSDGTNTITITEEGQAINITQWNLDDLSMTPPDDYNGNFFVTVSSVTLDEGAETLEPEDDSQLLTDIADQPAFEMSDDGSVLISAEDLLESQGIEGTTVSEVNYDGEDGVLIDNENETWTFWSDPDYGGPVVVDFNTADGGSHNAELSITAINEVSAEATEEVPAETPQVNQGIIVTTEELLAGVTELTGDDLAVSNVQSDSATITDLLDGTFSIEANDGFEGEAVLTYSVSDGESTIDASMGVTVEAEPADYTVAPGGVVNVAIPTEISGNDDVDHMVLSGLPDGVTPQSGIEDADGNYVISDLSQPVTLNVDSAFSGEVNVEMAGIDAMDQAVSGATGDASVEVDISYEMQGSSADTAAPITTGSEETASGDWTTADNTDIGIDVMDDASSFDNDDSDSSNNDVDTSNVDI